MSEGFACYVRVMTGTVPCDGGLTDIAHRGTLLYTDAMEHLGIPHAHGCVGAKHTENSADCYQATKKIKACSACGPFSPACACWCYANETCGSWNYFMWYSKICFYFCDSLLWENLLE